MDNARDVINKVLDKARDDIDASKKKKFEDAFAAFMRSQGIALNDGRYTQRRMHSKIYSNNFVFMHHTHTQKYS